jgi:hypothetical protein
MTTLTLKLEVNDHLAEIYRNAKPSEKSKIKALFNTMLEKALTRDKTRQKMYAVLDDLHAEALQNGLTDDVLEELLSNEI